MSCFVVWMKQIWIQLTYWQLCQTATEWNNNTTTRYCRGAQGRDWGLPGVTPAMCRNAQAGLGEPGENELLLTGFSFLREKLCVARLQREVAQSKSEGAMVSCAYSLRCNPGLAHLCAGWRCSPEHPCLEHNKRLPVYGINWHKCEENVHKYEETQGLASLEKPWERKIASIPHWN